MSSKRASLVAAAAFALGIVSLAFACNSDDDHPPVTSSSGGTTITSSGVAGSSGSPASDGSSPDTGTTSSSGTTSSGGSSGSVAVDPHLNASIDGTAVKFDVTPKAKREVVDGSVIVLSGADAAGNTLKVRIAKAGGGVTTGNYACMGDAAAPGGSITYSTTGAAETWQTIDTCSVLVTSITNQVGSKIGGSFTGTAVKAGSPDKVITGGDFSLTLE